MMEMAKVTSKGQITIPISIRRNLGIKEGAKILFIDKEDGVLMVNPDTFKGDGAEETTTKADKHPTKEPKKKIKTGTPSKSEPTPKENDTAPVAEVKEQPEEIKHEEIIHEKTSPDQEKSATFNAAPRKTTKAGGIDLSTLLDDIRSIGSNI